MIKVFFKIVSFIFHPLLLFVLLLFISYSLNPYSFGFSEGHEAMIMLIMAIVILVIIPLVTTLMMKGLGFIHSLMMHDPKERIGPLIAVIICYVWHYINVMNHQAIPDTYTFIALAGCISVGIVFFINNFTKISMHTVGAGALFMGTVILLYLHSFDTLQLHILHYVLTINPLLIAMITMIIAGLIGTGRLILGAHKVSDIYGGYAVGIVSILVALRIVF